MPPSPLRRAWPALFVLALTSPTPAATLKVPPGFECRLVAQVPAVTYPCQVATRPDGGLFVAEDPMDQVGPYEASDGRILLFRDGHDPVVFAEGFRAIFGMAWHDGALYVSHMPHLTILRDTDDDGRADRREALFHDLGPTDNKGLNDHIVSGLQFGMDGYLYISVGDKGIPRATGPDGRTIQLIGGGVIRCRPDGTGIEVVSTGTRNHLDANLDDRDNIFTYDNTDDGDGWWTRVTHHIDGGYYGYPYDYHRRPDRHLPRMAEYGGGSPCGAIVYKEDAWPEKYRGMGFWAEWGKGKVQAFRFAPDGATFRVAETIDFALPDGSDTFRPIDLALSHDGKTLYVADWNMGGWGSKTEKVGRVYAITYKGGVTSRPRGRDGDGIGEQIARLDHPSFNERMRAQAVLVKKGREALPLVQHALADPGTDPLAKRHLIWTLDAIAGGTPEAAVPTMDLLKSPGPDLRAQAARALGVRKVPIAVEPLIDRLKDPEPAVRLQAVIALGRIGSGDAVMRMYPVLAEPDAVVAFATRQALRRIDCWDTAALGVNSTDPKVRLGVLAAMELQYDPHAIQSLSAYALDGNRATDERAKALTYLAQGHRKPKPWDGKWWGTRPTQGKPPAKVVDWEGTELVLETVRRGLADREVAVRRAAIGGVVETRDAEAQRLLREQFGTEPDRDARREIALALGRLGDAQALPVLVAALRDPVAPEPVREAALTAVEAIGTDAATRALVELLGQADLAPDRQARVLAALGQAKAKGAVEPILAKLDSPAPAVRAASAEALGRIGRAEGVAPRLLPLAEDREVSVRKAAVTALGALKAREAIPALLAAAEGEETRFEATLALAAVADIKALQVYLRGLTDKNQEVRLASARAMAAIRDQAAPVLDQLAARHELSPAVVPELRKVFTGHAPIARWRVVGPFAPEDRPSIDPKAVDVAADLTGKGGKPVTWRVAQAVDDRGQIDLGARFSTGEAGFAYAYAEVQEPSARKAEMAVGSDDTLTVWLNGEQVYDFDDHRGFSPGQARFAVALTKGTNRVLVKSGNRGGGWQFAVALSTAADYAFLKAPAAGAFDPEAYRAFALKAKGNSERGRALFADRKGLACVKCHAVAGQGGTVGPDLSGIGAQYTREDLITSVLFPSAKIFSGYEPVVVATTDGRVLTGIVKADTAEALEIQDAEDQRIQIAKADVEERKASDVSLMPNGLAEGLTREDFADLIAYLETLKQAAAGSSQPGGGR